MYDSWGGTHFQFTSTASDQHATYKTYIIATDDGAVTTEPSSLLSHMCGLVVITCATKEGAPVAICAGGPSTPSLMHQVKKIHQQRKVNTRTLEFDPTLLLPSFSMPHSFASSLVHRATHDLSGLLIMPDIQSQCLFGILLCVGFASLYRELKPYGDDQTAELDNACQWAIVVSALALLVEPFIKESTVMFQRFLITIIFVTHSVVILIAVTQGLVARMLYKYRYWVADASDILPEASDSSDSIRQDEARVDGVETILSPQSKNGNMLIKPKRKGMAVSPTLGFETLVRRCEGGGGGGGDGCGRGTSPLSLKEQIDALTAELRAKNNRINKLEKMVSTNEPISSTCQTSAQRLQPQISLSRIGAMGTVREEDGDMDVERAVETLRAEDTEDDAWAYGPQPHLASMLEQQELSPGTIDRTFGEGAAEALRGEVGGKYAARSARALHQKLEIQLFRNDVEE